MSDKNDIDYDEYISSRRSPPLEEIKIETRITEPASHSLADTNLANLSSRQSREGDRPRAASSSSDRRKPELCDLVVLRHMGLDYTHVAEAAAKELLPSPESPQPAPQPPSAPSSMIGQHGCDVSRAAGETHVQTIAKSTFEASRKLNAITQHDFQAFHTSSPQRVPGYDRRADSRTTGHQRQGSAMSMSSDIHITLSPVSSLGLDVKPPPRVTLPSIKTSSPTSAIDRMHLGNDSIATSPALAKFAITSLDGKPDRQLPRMKTSPIMSDAGSPHTNRQTLPSLETALSALSTPNEAAYPGHSPPLGRLSPGHMAGQLAQYGPPSSALSPASAISPPRLPTAPYYYRTTVNRENSYSTSSDQTSSVTSAGISTPASSLQALSPANSANTPSTVIPDHDSNMSDDASMNGYMSGRPHDDSSLYQGGFNGVSFKCTYPGCNALPFQTQYLLNSHANVHSNTRPHFCPVEHCPRGPGGQGFKRKNEMIRHGLVHQSPGYVCPFCPEQQHKYPRPDNLQRHVRVHHVDRDRDDPLLREVLAQRPEGGNRGRRRRLGS